MDSKTLPHAMDNRHPRGFWFIFWGELAERASFYGMKILLLQYMIQKLGYTDANSASIVSIFTASCYILPIVGGYIADHWLGKFKTIIYFAVPYIIGQLILGTYTNEVGLYTALLLLAGGSGSIKPNISTLMGLMYQKAGKSHLMTQAFSWFYMAINIGSATTTLALPFLRDHYGYSVAFMAPTILMVVSLGIFYLGKKHYPMEDVKLVQRQVKTPEQKREERRILVRLSGLFVLIIFFWSIFDQTSAWILFARDYMILDITLFQRTWHIPPESLHALNPILIVIMTPLFAWIWSKTDKDETHKLSSPRKMLIGFFLVTSSMGIMTLAGYLGVQSKVSILWEAGATLVITMAELCISVVGLQLAFEEAPDSMKSLITGVWLFTVFLGNTLAALLVRVYTLIAPGNYFALLMGMMIVITVIFYYVGRRFEHGSGQNSGNNSARSA